LPDRSKKDESTRKASELQAVMTSLLTLEAKLSDRGLTGNRLRNKHIGRDTQAV
jgi:hypothetical protein